MPLVTQIYLI